MAERKLEPSDICSNLPYKLQVVKEDNEVNTVISIGGYAVKVEDENYTYICHTSEIKPLLIPTSEITKPLKVENYNNGNEFIPLIELIKTALQDAIKKGYYTDSDFTIKGNEVIAKHYRFGYSNLRRYFYGYNTMSRFDEITVLYQADLFQLLAQWHFDVNNLIGQGLAVNKLETKF